MAHTSTNDQWLTQDPELRESLRIIRRDHTWRLIAVAGGLAAALSLAFASAYLSYNDTLYTGEPAAEGR